MKKTLAALFFLLFSYAQVWSDSGEIPNFSLMFHGGAEIPTGFIPGTQPAPELGGWMGVGVSEQLDGFIAIDYYTMPNVPVTINGPATAVLPNSSSAVTTLQPADDIALSIDTRWYPFNKKWDYIHRCYNTSFYLFGGLGVDLLVDGPPPSASGSTPTQEFPILTTSYDILFGMNIGTGIDFPLGNGREVSVYTEALDHLIFWQGLTQVFDGRVGIRFMLDTAHVDPFR
jgi:hypothetical protein